MMVYSTVVFLLVVSHICYIQWDKLEMVQTTEGRFEEAVIDYLFTIYLVPVIIVPVTWCEGRKMADVFTEWSLFEKMYKKITGKRMPLFMGNKVLLVAIGLPILSCGTMAVNHVTMAHFRILHVSRRYLNVHKVGA